MRTSATCSGTAGTASPPDTSAPPDWLTIAMLACACGLIRCPSARTKVGLHTLQRSNGSNDWIFAWFQRWPTDSPAPRPVSWPTPDPSRATPTPRTAASTTSAWRAWPANTDAPSAQCSRSETVMALATARIPRMFPDGKLEFICNLSLGWHLFDLSCFALRTF